MLDVKALAAGLLTSVQEWISPTIKAIDDRLVRLDQAIKAVPAGPKGDPGEKGEQGLIGKDGAAGRDGIDGKDGAPGERGEAGQKGEAGERGEKGEVGERGGKGDKGDSGDAGTAGKDGERGEHGEKGADGIDGKSFTIEDVRGMFETEQAKWALDFERRAQDVLQRAVDKFPVPKDGRDAFELDDLSVEHDGDGGVTFRFVRGDLSKEFSLRLPRFKDCGVFREGTAHRAGDGVSFGGSFFIAQKDEPAGKPGDSEDWRLAVKRGRDGKDAPDPTTKSAPGPVRLK